LVFDSNKQTHALLKIRYNQHFDFEHLPGDLLNQLFGSQSNNTLQTPNNASTSLQMPAAFGTVVRQ